MTTTAVRARHQLLIRAAAATFAVALMTVMPADAVTTRHEVPRSLTTNAATIYGLSCVTVKDCVTVGDIASGMPLVIAGNPATWGDKQASSFTLPVKTFQNTAVFYGVSCPSAVFCVAVGTDQVTGEDVLAVGDPLTWKAAQVRQFAPNSTLNAVDCVTTTQCVAVGTYRDEGTVVDGNPALWTASSVHVLAPPEPTSNQTALTAVTCVNATHCVAVGGGPYSGPVVLRGNPAAWKSWASANATQVVFDSAFGSGGTLESVSCTSTGNCVGVGTLPTTPASPFVAYGNPANWTTQSAMHATQIVGGGTINAVQCTSATFCVAVGGVPYGSPFVMHGNPTTWTSATTANQKVIALAIPPGTGGSLVDLRCFTSTSCVATGLGTNMPVSFVGNPVAWTSASVREVNLN